jgi:hypothetical protein
MPEIFPRENIADVNFHHWNGNRRYSIGQRDGCVGVAPGVKDDPVEIAPAGMKAVDQLSLNVALEIMNVCMGEFFTELPEITLKGVMSVNIRFPLSQKIKIGAVNNHYLHGMKIPLIFLTVNYRG